MRYSPSFVMVAAALLSAGVLGCGSQAGDEDGINDTFVGAGKADSVLGVEEGSPTALGVLKVATETSLSTLRDASGVGLGSQTATNIVKVRAGADGVAKTADDVAFATLVQLDKVPYVGPKAFAKLVSYAQAHGYVVDKITLAAEADTMPWGGYYWSMLNGELVLGWDDGNGRVAWTAEQVRELDGCLSSYEPRCVALIGEMAGDQGRKLSPLMKFDLYVRSWLAAKYGAGQARVVDYSHASKWELENHYIGNNVNHRYWDSRGYAGKCIGWALANFDGWREPTKDVELGGIIFHPADIKGFLATIYNAAQYFVPDDQVMGNAYHDVEGANLPEYLDDVYPHDFLRALFATIGKGKMLEADLEPADGVWNYPIYRYEIEYERVGITSAKGSVRLFYVNDEVGIDEVFSTQSPRRDALSRDLPFELELPAGWTDLAQATGGRWVGEAVDTHPDQVLMALEPGWRTSVYQYKNTAMNTEVNFQLLKRFNSSTGWMPLIDDLLASYYARY